MKVVIEMELDNNSIKTGLDIAILMRDTSEMVARTIGYALLTETYARVKREGKLSDKYGMLIAEGNYTGDPADGVQFRLGVVDAKVDNTISDGFVSTTVIMADGTAITTPAG